MRGTVKETETSTPLHAQKMNTEQNQRTGTRIVYAITANYAYVFLKGRLRYLRAHGFCPVVVTGGDPKGIGDTGVEVINVPMTREISPARDFVSLFRLWLTLRRLRPAITNVSTPKAGLLAGL